VTPPAGDDPRDRHVRAFDARVEAFVDTKADDVAARARWSVVSCW
jgi:hypothetical protein